MDYLTPENWTELYKKYPHLAGEIAVMSLKNELEYLRHEVVQTYLSPERRKWVEERIKHIETYAIFKIDHPAPSEKTGSQGT